MITNIDNANGSHQMNAADAYTKADNLANEVTNFYAAAVGRGINTNEEFCLLVEWRDAIDAAIAAALSVRDFRSDKEYCAMLDECNMWLDHWQEASSWREAA